MNENFMKLGLIEPILKSIEDQHFIAPTSIQEKTLPLILDGKDVIGGSRTGSGKTLAFSCGIIQKAEKGKGIQALVLVPTRELAEQVADAFKTFSKYKKLNIMTVYGGVSINPQIDDLRHTDIVIGTPGRLLDHLERRTIDLRRVNTLVLDEADMMLDMGFLPDVERIIRHIPKERQTMLFSATITEAIYNLTLKHMNDAIRISAEEMVDPSKLTQSYYDVMNNKKFALLVHLLQQEKEGLVMVFCNTRVSTDFVEKNLKLNGIQCQGIHGGLTQNRRSSILKSFHKGKVYVLVCTDVAGRGLDIKGVSHVYNYDTCKDPKQYIHRIGRTARAGKDGKAITLLSDRDYENFTRVLEINKIDIPKEETPQFGRVKMNFNAGQSKRQSGFGGRRSNRGGGRPRHGRR